MSPRIKRPFFQRLFSLQFTRKLLLFLTSGLAFIFGVFLMLRFFPEKAFEFSSPYFGTIKTTATAASNYLAEIETIRRRVEGQRDTIDAAFANAAAAQRASSNATAQVVLAREQLWKMETNAAFLELVARAYSDDREAFDELFKIYSQAADRAGFATNLQAYHAVGAVNAVVDLHNAAIPSVEPPRFPKGIFLNGKELKENEISADEVRLLFQTLGVGGTGILLQWFSHCERFPRLQRLEVLLAVRKTSKSLYMCEWAAREFCRLTGLAELRPLHPSTLRIMEDWLRENGPKIKD